MASLSTLAQSKAVAPPGRKERALMEKGSIPVDGFTSVAAWRRALVMCVDLMRYHLLCEG